MKILHFTQAVFALLFSGATIITAAVVSSELPTNDLNNTAEAKTFIVGSTLSESYSCRKSRVEFQDTIHAKDAMIQKMPEQFEIPHDLGFPWSPVKSGKSVAFVCTRGAFNTVSRESVNSAFGFLDEKCGKGVSGHYSWDYAFMIGRAAIGESVCGKVPSVFKDS